MESPVGGRRAVMFSMHRPLVGQVDAVMPFGCFAQRDGRNFNSPTDITDKYEIGQVLRAKEFCELCLAKDRQTDKVYVCKKFLKKDGRKVRKAAKNEIMILKMVNHPNILQLIDTFETRKEYYIIQELATGGDVFDWILDQGSYTERDASNVIRQVLEAVAYLHSLNIVHRNLKLENLMYYTENNHNKVVLRDFYLSKFENGSITEPCGTPEYLAPEVVARHRYGRPVDCWAVGVIMYILLSGNPPFYDETEEENTDLHNRIIFCRIVAGEFEFDSPYWDDISPAAKELVCRLMEVDQMLRITAQEALWHEWIAGNGASEKNLKDGVCAQFEKNFAKAKWRKAIRITTFMQRLRAPESGGVVGGEGSPEVKDKGDGGEGRDMGVAGATPTSRGSVSHEVVVESVPRGDGERGLGGANEEGKKASVGTIPISPSVGVSPTSTTEPLTEHNPAPTPLGEVVDVSRGGARKGARDDAQKLPATATTATATGTPGPDTTAPEKKVPLLGVGLDPTRRADSRSTKVIILEQELASRADERSKLSPEMPGRCKAAAAPSADLATAATAPPVEQDRPAQQTAERERRPTAASSWCQTQLPEAVAERSLGVGLGGPGDLSSGGGRGGEAGLIGKRSPELGLPRVRQSDLGYGVAGSPSLGRKSTVSVPEQREGGAAVGPSQYSYSASGGTAFGGLGQGVGVGVGGVGDWQMDSVIEQIEKQMAAVLEKIEGDMPSLLEQISDCPEQRPKSAHSSPSARSRPHAQRHSTPPPLPTTPRPPLPSLPHLTIPPPSYPPPSPPALTQPYSQPASSRDEKDAKRGGARSGQSARGGVAGRGL
ncbi:caM kinase-like vesicle-associated, like isoform X2 [Anguilla anguilla]|uniref:caM kinase-like vesicle-associated, like isoform X2 n=1 Tax=Anguilla anguilla TaxID=7936 RepID=UPI0015B30848|nr:caM kinase-like vesicle-associated, like isoform X2 [Anguilla anguilla]